MLWVWVPATLWRRDIFNRECGPVGLCKCRPRWGLARSTRRAKGKARYLYHTQCSSPSTLIFALEDRAAGRQLRLGILRFPNADSFPVALHPVGPRWIDEYIEKMEDVLSVYERPYSPVHPVVCLDEKPVSLHADVRPARPMVPGHSIRRDNEYKRNGTANIFAVVEPKAGRHFTRATPDRSGLQFALLVRDIVTAYPSARTIHLVMDNLNIHRKKSLTDHLGAAQADYLWSRLGVHYTPKHGSWLNQAEIELSLISRQCLGKRRIPTLERLQSETRAWTQKADHQRLRIQWRFTRKNARQKFGYLKNVSMRSQT
jgi:transposase